MWYTNSNKWVSFWIACVYLVPRGSIDTETHPSVDALGDETDALLVWPFPAVAADPLLILYIHVCMWQSFKVVNR